MDNFVKYLQLNVVNEYLLDIRQMNSKHTYIYDEEYIGYTLELTYNLFVLVLKIHPFTAFAVNDCVCLNVHTYI